jgi:hypothetical protein
VSRLIRGLPENTKTYVETCIIMVYISMCVLKIILR